MLKRRLITAMLLGTVFVTALFSLSDTLWAIFLLGFITIGAWEWGVLSGFSRRGRGIFSACLFLSGLVLLPDLASFSMIRHWSAMALIGASTLFWFFVAPLWLARQWHIRHPVLAILIGTLLLLPPWIALVDLRQIGPSVVLMAILTVAIADSAAYFSGKRFGKHKLAPSISPGKTWEGVMGAMITVTVFGTGLCLWSGWNPWFATGFLVLVVLSVIGDLFESLIKRQAGKKDSGSLLPGHGGVLDRIDGLTSTLPLVACYAYLNQMTGWFASI